MMKTTFLVNFTLKTHFSQSDILIFLLHMQMYFFVIIFQDRTPCVLGYLTHVFKNISHTLSQNYATT